MLDRNWDDDSDYRSAVRRTRIMMALASVVILVVIAAGVVAVFGVSLFLDLAEILSG
ncbi:hypothetical protein ACF05T_02985 [Streptomyces lateritius]|uniref:Uncharacterized protein n=1 Tax=Streptomyces lateritius TaxID=67313 RepID=A0ABW6Y646_9ACTN